jgi:hypothetical protein
MRGHKFIQSDVGRGLRRTLGVLAIVVMGLAATVAWLAISGYAGGESTPWLPATFVEGTSTSPVLAEGGCPVVLDGSPYVEGNVFRMPLSNTVTASIPLESIWFAFPAENAPLVGVNLNEQPLTSPDYRDPTPPATLTAGVNLSPTLAVFPAGLSHLDFVFTQPVASSPYAVDLGFPNRCRVVYPGPCQVEIVGDGPLTRIEDTVWLTMRNTGPVPAELHAVEIGWNSALNGTLRKVTLGDTVIWEGEAPGNSATIELPEGNSVPGIEPGTEARLGLTFEQTASGTPYGLLKIEVRFLEGCAFAYAPQPPRPVEFRGIIAALPEDGYIGEWEIQAAGRAEPIEVLVTEETIIEPEGARPQVGDSVAVTAIPTGEKFLATLIRLLPSVEKQVEVKGVIEDFDSENQPPRWMIVQGITVILNETTSMNRAPVRGWIAYVIGTRQPDGTVLAQEVAITNPEASQEVEFSGVVEGWQQLSDQQSLWIINGIQVIVDVAQTVHHGIEPGQQPELGVGVLVRGLYQSDDTVLALEIWYGSPEEEVLEFEGIIISLPDHPDLLGVWEILDVTANELRAVRVTDETFIIITDTLPDVEVPVLVRAREEDDGSLVALRIEILPVAR